MPTTSLPQPLQLVVHTTDGRGYYVRISLFFIACANLLQCCVSVRVPEGSDRFLTTNAAVGVSLHTFVQYLVFSGTLAALKPICAYSLLDIFTGHCMGATGNGHCIFNAKRTLHVGRRAVVNIDVESEREEAAEREGKGERERESEREATQKYTPSVVLKTGSGRKVRRITGRCIGVGGCAGTPLNFYVLGRPTKWVDPLGRHGFLLLWAWRVLCIAVLR